MLHSVNNLIKCRRLMIKKVKVIIYDTVCLKLVYMSMVVLDLYKGCIILVSQVNWPCYVVLK